MAVASTDACLKRFAWRAMVAFRARENAARAAAALRAKEPARSAEDFTRSGLPRCSGIRFADYRCIRSVYVHGALCDVCAARARQGSITK